MNTEKKYATELRALVKDQGAPLFGVADIGPLKSRFYYDMNELTGINIGICIGVPLSKAVLSGITDHPTLIYKWHYRQANLLLDQIAYRVTLQIIAWGYRAIPIPASQVVDWTRQLGAVSHRMVAEAAGIGWRGRNNLIVHPVHGAHLRLVTVLTDLPLETASPMSADCGMCRKCIDLCPAGALGETAADYDLEKCHRKLTEFSKMPGIGQHICGVCVKACRGRE